MRDFEKSSSAAIIVGSGVRLRARVDAQEQ
jgi:hypothetical protein